MWRWDQAEPFGANPTDHDPDANSVAFDLPLRLPGQRYDAETGLHYNYSRDYDPSHGRFVESDPIGLLGGLNTYAYIGGRPLHDFDPFGLQMNIEGSPVTAPPGNQSTKSCRKQSCEVRCRELTTIHCPFGALSPAHYSMYGTNERCIKALNEICYYGCHPSETLKDPLRTATEAIANPKSRLPASVPTGVTFTR